MAGLDTMLNGKFLDPSTGIQATGGNYQSIYDFTNQYYPDTMPEMVNLFNPQSITGFLDTMGYEESMGADLSIWAESGRRHKLHTTVARTTNVFTSVAHSVRVQDKILVFSTAAPGKEIGLVTEVTADTFTAAVQDSAAWTVALTGLNVRVMGSEFGKGTLGKEKALTRDFNKYSISPVISKDKFEIDGSDIPNITWVYTTSGEPYWYMEDEKESFMRFLDNIEFQALEDIEIAGTSTLTGFKGTQGLFSSIRERGNTFAGKMSAISDIDDIINRLDKVNGEMYNGLYISTAHGLAIDNFLSSALGHDAATADYGVYGMGKQRVLELGFKGFRRSTYEFNYSGWNILKDPTALHPDMFNAADQIHGIMVPMGMTTDAGRVDINSLDRMVPEAIQYLTQLYKAKPGYSRKLITSYAGGAMVSDHTSTMDRYEIHWLTERCLRAVGMLKWMLFQGA